MYIGLWKEHNFVWINFVRMRKHYHISQNCWSWKRPLEIYLVQPSCTENCHCVQVGFEYLRRLLIEQPVRPSSPWGKKKSILAFLEDRSVTCVLLVLRSLIPLPLPFSQWCESATSVLVGVAVIPFVICFLTWSSSSQGCLFCSRLVPLLLLFKAKWSAFDLVDSHLENIPDIFCSIKLLCFTLMGFAICYLKSK